LVEGNAVPFDERDEIARRVASECGAGEVWVGGEEAFSRAVEISEIAAAATGDEDLFANAIGTIENKDAVTALSCGDGSHEAGSSGAKDEDVATFLMMAGWGRVRRHACLLLIMSDSTAMSRCQVEAVHPVTTTPW